MGLFDKIKGNDPDPLIQKIRLMNAAVWLALIGAGLVFMPWRFTLGIVAGGLVILTNFHLLARALKSGLNPSQLTTPMAVIAKYYLRLLGTAIVSVFPDRLPAGESLRADPRVVGRRDQSYPDGL